MALAARDMSFLHDDDDNGATLAATLAFLDECDYADDFTSCAGDLTSTGDNSELRSTDDDSDSKTDDEPTRPATSASRRAAHTVTLVAANRNSDKSADSTKQPSLRVVIRTTSNKRLTAATSTAATAEPQTTLPVASAGPTRQKRLSARAPTPMQRPTSYPNKESVLRFRARKKAEAEQLRAEVVALEAELAKLRRRGCEEEDATISDDDNSGDGSTLAIVAHKQTTRTNRTLWMDEAIRQARERHKAEALNKQLRDAVTKQKTMGDALQTLLGNMSESATAPSLVDSERLADAQKEAVYYDTFASVETRTMFGLEASIAQMYKFSDAVFPPVGVVDVPVQSVQVLPGHPETGPAAGVSYVEIRTTTPLGCTYLEAAEMIWSLITTPPPTKDKAYYVTKTQQSETRYQKNYTIFLDRPDGAVELKGFSLLYRNIEADRVTFMWASTVTAASVDGPTIREKGWVTVSKPTPAHPHIPAALQVCHQIFSDDHARATAMSRFSFGNPTFLDRAYAEHAMREFVLSYIVNRTRAQYENIQTFFLRTLGTFVTRHQIETHMPETLHC